MGSTQREGGLYFLVFCYLAFPVFLFFLTLWITQLLGLGASQNRQYKTGKMTLPTKEQVKIALAVATVGVVPLVNFSQKFFRHRKYRKMIKGSSAFILEEFANIVNNMLTRLEKDGRIKTPLHKEVLKFESTALVFWLFRVSSIFSEPLHKLILDKMHDQYYARLKMHGYDRNAVQAVCDDLNLRYRTYDKFTDSTDDFVKVGTNFAKFLSERSKTGLDARETMIPGELIERATTKFKEFHEVMQ